MFIFEPDPGSVYNFLKFCGIGCYFLNFFHLYFDDFYYVYYQPKVYYQSKLSFFVRKGKTKAIDTLTLQHLHYCRTSPLLFLTALQKMDINFAISITKESPLLLLCYTCGRPYAFVYRGRVCYSCITNFEYFSFFFIVKINGPVGGCPPGLFYELE